MCLDGSRAVADEKGSVLEYEGLIVRESLKDAGVLDKLQITRTEVWDVQGGAAFQPSTWTAMWVHGDERRAGAVAEMLSQSLHAEWYCNIATERHSFVVFGGRVFKYPRGDERGRAEAQAYGRSLGLPEKQLEWGEDYPLSG